MYNLAAFLIGGIELELERHVPEATELVAAHSARSAAASIAALEGRSEPLS
jgi:hypothetical protein